MRPIVSNNFLKWEFETAFAQIVCFPESQALTYTRCQKFCPIGGSLAPSFRRKPELQSFQHVLDVGFYLKVRPHYAGVDGNLVPRMCPAPRGAHPCRDGGTSST